MNTHETNKQPTSEEVTQNAAQNTTDGNETTSISEASKTETSETIADEVKPNEDTNETNTPKDEISNMEQESKTNLKKEDIKINEKSEISDKEETKTNNKTEVTANLDEDNKENIDYKDKDEMCSKGNKESLEGKDSKEITKTNNESEVIALLKDDSKNIDINCGEESEETTNSNISIAIAAKRKRSDSSKSFEQSDREEDNNNALNNTTSEMNDGEAEFEDVEIPDGEEELIVPDETGNAESEDEGIDGVKDSDKALIANAEEEEESKHTTKSSEGEESNFSAIEPELVAIEESSKDDNNLDEEQQTANDDDSSNLTAYDPLNCLADQDATGSGGDSNGCEANSNTNVEINMVSGESNDTGRDSNDASASNANKEDEDDDDEVQFVETRNSPICIESDEEDSNSNSQSNVAATASKRETRSRLSAKNNSEAGKQTINLPSATITVPKNLTVIRTSARKSTSRPQQYNNSPSTTVPPQQQHNKSKNFQYLQNATTYRRSMPPASRNVDTIDLLDSSDDESNNGSSSRNKSLPHTFKTPPKRTLMAAKSVNKKSPNKMTFVGGYNNMPSNFAAQIRRQPKKPAPPPLPPPTPQSNFLNAVQLQPATGDSNNPPAFSALLSNKSVIIPNAFYGNPPALRGADLEKEKRYARWLDNFITQFCNPQLVASHSCFVFLQRALKYKDFVHIKNIRTGMNMQAQTAKEQINNKLMLELRATFLKNSKEITTHGRRFCELTCSMVDNKSVTLLVHGITSRVIMKTCNLEIPSSSSASSSATNTNSSPTSSSSTTRKRHLDEDEDEYVPGKNKVKNFTSSSASLENTDHSSGDSEGPKRSLRSKRTKRIDNNFSYNEDDLAEYDLEDEEEQAERLAREAVQKKIDQKRLEAQRQRQQQAESFESAFLQTFAKGLDGRAPTSLPPARTAGE